MLSWMIKNRLAELLITQAHAQSFMPAEGSQIAKSVDSLYSFLLIISLIACIIVIGGMVYFALKYKRRSSNDKTAYISHDTRLEILWSVIPLLIFLFVFAWGWIIYHDMRTMPKEALEIQVTGRQWAWVAEYKNGVQSPELVVPVKRDIRLVLGSPDVIHSFYIPSFRIKQDVVPGRYNSLWFRPEVMGEFHVFCAEFCGTSHSGMITKLRVVSQADFDKWLIEEADSSSLPPVDLGKKLFTTKTCASCHFADQAGTKIGPSLKGLFGSENHQMDDGSTVNVDENYLRESILSSQTKIVKGFGPRSAMPAFQGQLSEKEVSSLIEYIKSIK